MEAQCCPGLASAGNEHGPTWINYPELRTRLLKEVKQQLPDGDLLRVYWYDHQRFTGKSASHSAIDLLDDFKLRLVTPDDSRHSSSLDCEMLADLMELAHHRAISHALMMSDSVGLVSGVRAVQSRGVRVHLLTVGEDSMRSSTLTAEVDTKRTWGTAELIHFVTGLTKDNQPAEAPRDIDIRHRFEAHSGMTTHKENSSLTWVAQMANTRIKEGPQAVVFAALKPGLRSLPREIDSALLLVGRQELGRALTEPEKRELRREFQTLIREEFEERIRKTHVHTEVCA